MRFLALGEKPLGDYNGLGIRCLQDYNGCLNRYAPVNQVQLPQLRGDSRRHSLSGVRNARNNAALHKAEIAAPSHKAAEIE